MLRDLLQPGEWLTKVDLKNAPTSWFLYCFPPQMATLFQLARADIPVQLPAIRPVISPLGLYQDHTTCYCHPQSIRSEGNNLYQQHTDHGGDTNAGRGCVPLPALVSPPAGLIFFLENLGFIINFPKSVLSLTQNLEFLGFAIDFSKLEIKLPGETIKWIKQEAKKPLSNSSRVHFDLSY